MRSSRFIFWIILFSILLSVIPVLFLTGNPVLGKIFGIVLTISLSVALWIWRQQTRKFIAYNQRIRLNTNDRFWLKNHVPFYLHLGAKDQVIFEDRLGLVLSNVTILDLDDAVVDRNDAIALSALATIFTWDLPLFVFENSNWKISQSDTIKQTEPELVFSLYQIKNELKNEIMLKNLKLNSSSGIQSKCIENFLYDIGRRYVEKGRKSSYEKDFWIFFTTILNDVEYLKKVI